MNDNRRKKDKNPQQKKQTGFSPKEIHKIKKHTNSLKRSLGMIIAFVAIVLYANTLNNGFVLDDFGLIKDNLQTKKGISAIPAIFKSSYRYGMNMVDNQLYRPLTKAMFAVEWNIAPEKPVMGHGVNIIFYALLCYVLFRMLSSYMNGSLAVPFLTALLFAAHPLHTEVVANIKGRDEIVCFLLCLSATWSFHSYATRNSKAGLVGGILFYFFALFAKESAITFLAVIPLFYYFFTTAGIRKYFFTLLGMAVGTAIFLFIRNKVLGHVVSKIPMEDNSLVAIKDIIVQRANAIYIMGVYLKLFVLPFPLIADGSYNHFPAVGLTSWKFLVPFVILVSAGIYAIVRFRKKDIFSFAIIYFFITASLISNVIMLIGTNYGERLMFVPLLSFCIIVSVLLVKYLNPVSVNKIYADVKSFLMEYSKPVIVVGIVVVLFGIQTMGRNTDWKNDHTLYSTDVKKVPDSAHMLFYYANNISSEEYLDSLPDSTAKTKTLLEAIDVLTRAVTIYPKYTDGFQRRGFIYNQMGNPAQAESDYKSALLGNPTHHVVNNNYGTLCFAQHRYEEALEYFQKAAHYNPLYAHAWNNLGSVYGVFGQGEGEMANKDPANRETHLQKSRQYFETAVTNFLESINVDAKFGEPYRLVAITYRNLGDTASAERYELLYKEVMAMKHGKD